MNKQETKSLINDVLYSKEYYIIKRKMYKTVHKTLCAKLKYPQGTVGIQNAYVINFGYVNLNSHMWWVSGLNMVSEIKYLQLNVDIFQCSQRVIIKDKNCATGILCQ